jgi:hypothetical protein
MDSDEQNTPLVLARNVQNFVVECWNTNTMDWVDEWLDTNSIPPLLRVSLVLGNTADPGNQASALAITRSIAIPSMMLPSLLEGRRGSTGQGGPGGPGAPGGGVPIIKPGGSR